MKLLLTSMGVTNKQIQSALVDLLGKPIKQSSVLFVPTASSGEGGDKWWFVDDIKRTYDLGWKQFDVLSFESLPKAMFLDRLREVDALYVEGGNNYFLAEVIRSHGLVEPLDTFINQNLWIGASAGSMLFCKHTGNEKVKPLKSDMSYMEEEAAPVFDYFDWGIMPHFHGHEFGAVRDTAWAEQKVNEAGYPIYFIDDSCGIKVDGTDVEVVGDGKWELLGGET